MSALPLDPKPWAYSRASKDDDNGPFGHNDRAASRIDGAMMFFPRDGYEQDGDKYP